MSDEIRPERATDVLNQLACAADADTRLVKMFFDELREYAQVQIGKDLQRRVGASDVANAAIRSALSEVKNKPNEDWSTERFRKLAKRITKHKVLDAGEKQRAAKRDAGLDQSLVDGQHDRSHLTDDPVERLAARELAAICASDALSAVAMEDMSEVKRTIALLAVGRSYTAPEIREILARLPSQPQVSLRLIQLVCQKVEQEFSNAIDRHSANV